MRPVCLLIDYFGCNPDALDDSDHLSRVLQAWGGQVAGEGGHDYEPQGVSRLLVTANARLLLHTWPEYGSASLDVWSREGVGEVQAFAEFVGREVQAQEMQVRPFLRHP